MQRVGGRLPFKKRVGCNSVKSFQPFMVNSSQPFSSKEKGI